MFTHLVVEEITPSFCKRWLRLWVCSNWWSSSRPLQEMRCKSCHWTRRFYECRFSLRVDDFRRNLSYIFAIDDLETHANWRFPNHRLKNVSPKQSRDSPGKWLGERIYWAAISHTDQGFWCHTLASDCLQKWFIRWMHHFCKQLRWWRPYKHLNSYILHLSSI